MIAKELGNIFFNNIISYTITVTKIIYIITITTKIMTTARKMNSKRIRQKKRNRTAKSFLNIRIRRSRV